MGSLKDRHKWYTVIERPIWPIEAHSIVKCKSKMFESTTYRTHYPEVLYPENEQRSFNLIPPRTTKKKHNHWITIHKNQLGSWELKRSPAHWNQAGGKLPEIAVDTLAKLITWNLKKCCFAKRNVLGTRVPNFRFGGMQGGPYQLWMELNPYQWPFEWVTRIKNPYECSCNSN